MGRTVTPYSQEYAAFQQRAQKLRRALRQEDQLILDELLEQGRLHTAAGVYAAAPLPMESALLSILVEHKKTINALQTQLTELRTHLQLPPLPTSPVTASSQQQPRLRFSPAERGAEDDDTHA